MKVLQKTLLASVAGGETEEVSLFSNGGGGWGADDWGGAGGYGNSEFSGGSYSLGQFGSIGGNFDSNGVGAQSCVSQAASGMFGLSMTETLGVATAATGVLAGLGQGIGASLAIETAGGFGAIGGMGAGAAGLVGSAALGVGGALVAGGAIGTLAYNNSETLRDFSQATVGNVLEAIEQVERVGARVFGIERTPHTIYHP